MRVDYQKVLEFISESFRIFPPKVKEFENILKLSGVVLSISLIIYNGSIKKFKDWSLNSLIDVAHETNFIELDVKKFSHSLRDFRNYIHPEEQVAQNFNPDKNTAILAYHVLLAAMEDLNKRKRH